MNASFFIPLVSSVKFYPDVLSESYEVLSWDDLNRYLRSNIPEKAFHIFILLHDTQTPLQVDWQTQEVHPLMADSSALLEKKREEMYSFKMLPRTRKKDAAVSALNQAQKITNRLYQKAKENFSLLGRQNQRKGS